MWYADVDWADTHHVVVVVDETGQQVATKQVEHTVEGLAQLTSFLLDIVGTPERREELACIIETTHGLLITALLEAGFPVYPVNPKTVDRHRKPAGAKTDAIDAYLLARTGRSDFADLRRLKPDSALIQELKTLTRDQESLIASQTRLVNQLTACLKTYYPVALTLFSKLQRPSTLAFLQAYPTPQAAQQASLEDILLLLKQAKHRRLARVGQRIWEQLRQPSLQADAITTRAKSRLMLALVQPTGCATRFRQESDIIECGFTAAKVASLLAVSEQFRLIGETVKTTRAHVLPTTKVIRAPGAA